jgi:hypothetical protein
VRPIKTSLPLAADFETERKKPKIIGVTTTDCDSELDFQDAGVEPSHGKYAANGSDVLIGRSRYVSTDWAIAEEIKCFRTRLSQE